MKCLNCKNFDLQALKNEPIEIRKSGWAPCKKSVYAKSKYNGERWQGIHERESCQPGAFELADAETIAARKKYLGVEDG